VDTNQLITEAENEAARIGVSYNRAVLADTIRNGLPDPVVFWAPGQSCQIRRRGDVIEYFSGGKLVNTATLQQVGLDLLLVCYAITEAASWVGYVIQRGQRYWSGARWTRAQWRAHIYRSREFAEPLARRLSTTYESWHPRSRYTGAVVREVANDNERRFYQPTGSF
jgi:hypothetical protein